MLVIHFEGWFQCRLATDPDPSDEPRGVSGAVFALVGEPDLDRIIRLQYPVAPRFPGPEVGVRVKTVRLDGQHIPDHPLVGAQFDLLDDAKFEGQNGVIVTRDTEFINPFHLQISQGDDLSLRRRDLLDPQNPDLTVYEIDPTLFKRRQYVSLETNSVEVMDAAGIIDPVQYWQKRLQELEEALTKANGDPMLTAGLEQRIEALKLKDWRGKRLILLLAARETYKFPINGPAEVIDKQNVLKGQVMTYPDWPIEFWMGAWDNDALCGYMKGTLSIPFKPFKG